MEDKKIKISTDEYQELMMFKRRDDNLKTYRRNYYRNRYLTDENFRYQRKLANKKYHEKIKNKKDNI